MKNIIQSLLISGVLIIAAMPAHSQCDVGEIDTWIVAYSYDVWAEETYWEIVPTGNGCGNGSLASGSNEEVGCGIGGPSGENGMPDYGAEFANICLVDGQSYDLYFFDSYGDGGLAFDVFQNGLLTGTYFGTGAGNVWTFQAGYFPYVAYDSACGAAYIAPDGASLSLQTNNCIASFGEIQPPALSCGTYGMWCEGDATQTAWAYFLPEAGLTYEISTCNPGTNFDTQIAIWKGTDCGNVWDFELISASDDTYGGCNSGNAWASTCYAGCLQPNEMYFVQIDGYWGQVGNVEITIKSFDGETFLNTAVNDVNCPVGEGQPVSGSIFPSVFGMGSNFDCVWTSSNGFNSQDPYITNVGPGTYNLQLTTPCGEVFTGQYVINQPTQWDVEISVTNSSCPESTDGVISVDASGGNPDYEYYYDGPSNFSASGQTVDYCPMGTYIVAVVDANGCVYAEEITIDTDDDFTVELGLDTTICLGEDVLFLAPNGLNYLWIDGSENQTFTFNSNEWGAGVSAVLLTASTDDGCIDTDVVLVTVEVCIGVDEMTESSFVLYPNPASEKIILRTDRNSNYQYNVIDASGRIVSVGRFNSEVNEISIDGLESGFYTISISGEAEYLENLKFMILR
ncbi:MAG: T9SS type A sorting domain-containing protein [Flavobacteriales bacterium]|nr:T9SS type A sorting domain-containing protein [Flavobacteriales bacterium]